MVSLRERTVFGIFVAAILVAVVVILITLGGVWDRFKPRTSYAVMFDLETGAMGLKPESVVRIGGQDSGAVTDVHFLPEEGVPTQVMVTIKIGSRIQLYKDARVTLETPLLGSVSTLNFPSTGTPGAGVAPPDHQFRGVAAPGLLAQAGLDKEQIKDMVGEAKNLLRTANNAVGTVDKALPPILGNVTEATGNARDLTGSLRDAVKRWVPRIDTTMDNVSAASGELNQRLLEAKDLLASVQKLISDNRAKIDDAIENLRAMFARVSGELLPQVERILGQGERAATAAADTLDSLRALVREEDPQIRLALANLRLASDELKLTLAEIRRNPWRLTYQPGAKELDREMLYEAARTYASAVGELRATTASLQQISAAAAAGGASAPSKEQVDALIKAMTDSYARYKRTEDAFLKRLLAEPPAGQER